MNYQKILENLTQPIWQYGPAGWQKCPLYKGGKEHKCNVCNGKKIINITTGKPPK